MIKGLGLTKPCYLLKNLLSNLWIKQELISLSRILCDKCLDNTEQKILREKSLLFWIICIFYKLEKSILNNICLRTLSFKILLSIIKKSCVKDCRNFWVILITIPHTLFNLLTYSIPSLKKHIFWRYKLIELIRNKISKQATNNIVCIVETSF